MSRWDSILKYLPPCLRNPVLLDELEAEDLKLAANRANQQLMVVFHYAAGVPRFSRLTLQKDIPNM